MADLRAGLTTGGYHVVQFQRGAEAAAFLAALSRFLNSPAGDSHRSGSQRPEVWVGANQGEGVELYLDDAALEAVRNAFSPVPVSRQASRSELVLAGGRLLLGGDDIPAYGVVEIEQLLMKE